MEHNTNNAEPEFPVTAETEKKLGNVRFTLMSAEAQVAELVTAEVQANHPLSAKLLRSLEDDLHNLHRHLEVFFPKR